MTPLGANTENKLPITCADFANHPTITLRARAAFIHATDQLLRRRVEARHATEVQSLRGEVIETLASCEAIGGQRAASIEERAAEIAARREAARATIEAEVGAFVASRVAGANPAGSSSSSSSSSSAAAAAVSPYRFSRYGFGKLGRRDFDVGVAAAPPAPASSVAPSHAVPGAPQPESAAETLDDIERRVGERWHGENGPRRRLSIRLGGQGADRSLDTSTMDRLRRTLNSPAHAVPPSSPAFFTPQQGETPTHMLGAASPGAKAALGLSFLSSPSLA